MIYPPVEGGVESVKVVFSLGGFFLGSSLSSWTWSLVASPEVVIKNTKLIQGARNSLIFQTVGFEASFVSVQMQSNNYYYR